VNDNPLAGANAFRIDDGGSLILSAANLSATDVDNAAGNLTFSIVGGVLHGHFEYVSSPGMTITSFTQADIAAGLVRFVHDGSGQVPAFTISITDPSGGGVGPFAANISFTGSGFVVTPPSTGGSGSGDSLPSFVAPPLATAPGGSTEPGATGFLRGPTEPPSGGADTDETPVEQPAGALTRGQSGVVPQDKVLIPDSQLQGVRVEAEVIETKPLRSEIQVDPMRPHMEVLPVGGEEPLDLEEEDRQRIEIVLNSVRITGLALSVGAVWWAARAAGLLASLLTVTPAWQHVDPLPVLGRGPEEEEEDVDEDKDRRDDEHRARWVLDERAGRA
jgi:hypothetical protein